MKKNLLLVCFLMVSALVFSQARMAIMPEGNVKKMVANKVLTTNANPAPNSTSAPQPIWSDVFSNPANWVIAHDQNACSLDWQI